MEDDMTTTINLNPDMIEFIEPDAALPLAVGIALNEATLAGQLTEAEAFAIGDRVADIADKLLSGHAAFLPKEGELLWTLTPMADIKTTNPDELEIGG